MKNWNKNIYRVLLLFSFIGINAAILFGIGAVWVYMNSGADKASILHLSGETEDNYLPDIEWMDLENPGRPMEPQTLQEIEKDYLRSWYVRAIAFDSNDPYGLEDYYTDSLRQKLATLLELNKANGTRVRLSTISHRPTLEFYSLDGKMVVFTDEDVAWYSEVWQGEKRVQSAALTSSFRVMMLLEDGFWRVRHFEEVFNKREQVILGNDQIHFKVNEVKGLNYYPAKTPWNTFGDDFDGEVIREDFRKIKSMGLNTIRIFVPYEEFGGPRVEEERLQRLERLMDHAEGVQLKVLVTLFDFYGNYDLLDWTRTHRHAETLVKALRDHPALLGWDIKNEPDLDFDDRGKEEVLAWLREMIRQIKKYDPDHPITIGWSSLAAASNLVEEVDYISCHFYGDPDNFVPSYKALLEKIGNKEVVISEFGFSSYSGFWNFFTGSEESQAANYQIMVTALKGQELPFLSWTLYDFNEIPKSVVGRYPWRKAPQRFYGIIDSKGREKTAYGVMVQSIQK
ncbi:Cellulase (glycosyl hydrolase family 5) [Muriicola jejuensis]|uniref:mannan endo-1,4-beta-mannosidase n=1 Tax=Muriicola jejuensis TaxID=504488 RepID=A0A6P0UE99_9FLAO|nr:cellulase family glycosylhydrolase [Muriicola jejuensis]NER11601.1 cellulase family glycosylhydrolase [Muriicola jejuensis]SMP19345.1 Cellulase (glycosyl hydrolase family 5) [Muriicola jejuensis]